MKGGSAAPRASAGPAAQAGRVAAGLDRGATIGCLERPEQPSTYELGLPDELRLSEAAEVALEDYARVLTGSRAAEAVRVGPEPGRLVALRLTGLAEPPGEAWKRDVHAFALELRAAQDNGRLGWS